MSTLIKPPCHNEGDAAVLLATQTDKKDIRIKRLVAIKRDGIQFGCELKAVFKVYDGDGNLVDTIEEELNTLYTTEVNCINFQRTYINGRYYFSLNGEMIGNAFDFEDYAEKNCNPVFEIEEWPKPGGDGGPNGEHTRQYEIDDEFENR